MSLRVKSLLVASSTMAVLMVSLFITAQIILTDSYTRLEQQDMQAHVERALNALANDLATLQRTSNDYAVWDNTYAYMQERTPDYIESNYTDGAFANSRLNLVMLIDPQGQVVYAKAFDLDLNQAVPLTAQAQAQILQDEVLLQPTRESQSRSGLLGLPDGLYLIAAEPILPSSGEGQTRGALIMARALTVAEIAQLGEITQLQLTALDLNGTLDPETQTARAALSDQQPVVIRAANEQTIQGYGLIKDLHDQPLLLMRVDYSRTIYQQGQQTLSYLLFALLVAGVAVGSMLALLL